MRKEEEKDGERIEAVLQILRKQSPLTLKQEKFCNDSCVERFLKWKGDSVKKAAKQLRACLSWREAIGAEHLMADEFSSELAEGVAYVAGHDDEARPVIVFRIKQEYAKLHTQKSYTRLVVFTLEVAILSMSRFVERLVILFDASFFRSASGLLNLFTGTMKILSDYYPGRLHRAFVVDPPSIFPYLWKGARPFVDLWSSTSVVASSDFDKSIEDEHFSSFRASSLRFDASSAVPTTSVPATTTAANNIRGGAGSTSSRFSFTVSHFDSLKPWYLSRTQCGPPTSSPSLVGVSPVSARSFSFASPAIRGTKSVSIPNTPTPRTPKPTFLPSPATFFSFGRKKQADDKGKDSFSSLSSTSSSFQMYLRFYRKPYDEMVYRSKMRPPLGGLVSIVSPHVIRQQRCRHVSHQRF